LFSTIFISVKTFLNISIYIFKIFNNKIFIFDILNNNTVSGQPALLPTPQRPAVMAGNEIVAAQPVDYRTTEIVPSTSNPHKHFKRREAQVTYYAFFFLIY